LEELKQELASVRKAAGGSQANWVEYKATTPKTAMGGIKKRHDVEFKDARKSTMGSQNIIRLLESPLL
jgi:hypothetical protein